MTNKEDLEKFQKLKAATDEAIALAINLFNQIDVSLSDLFHALAGGDPRLADAIIGEPRQADLKNAIRRLTVYKNRPQEAIKIMNEVFVEVEEVQQHRNVLAHQRYHWEEEHIVFLPSNHEKVDWESRTRYTPAELTELAYWADEVSWRIRLELEPALTGRALDLDGKLSKRQPLHEKPKWLTSNRQQTPYAQKSRKYPRQ